MAAFPAIHCRCGIAFFTEPSLQALCAALCLRLLSTTAANPAIHCRCGTALFCRTLSTGLLSGIVPPLLFHNGSISRDSLPLRNSFFTVPSLQALCAALSFRSFSTMAAKPAILCRCGIAFFAAPLLQAICSALSLCPSSTMAAFPAILCRCGTAFFATPSLQALCAALSFCPSSTMAAKPAVLCRCGETGTFLLSLLAEILNE